MRIAYVCADQGVPVFGRKGCSIHVQEVVRALREQGACVELFARRTEGDPPPGLEAIPIHALPAVPRVVARSPDRATLPTEGLPPPAHYGRPSVDPVAGSGDPATTAVREQAALAANGEVRALLEQEGPFDLVYERYSLWTFAAMEYARDTGTPGLLEVNAPLIEEQVEHRTLVDRVSAERTAKRVFTAASALLAVSEEVAAYLEQYPGARGRVQVVPNGVDPERFPTNLAPSYPGSSGTFTVGFVGTLKPWHGLTTLVEAFALLALERPLAPTSGERGRGEGRNSNVRLLIVGDGPERSRLEADLDQRGLRGSAVFTGAVSPLEVPGLLASMDVAVAPYPKLANFYFSPLKVYEYIAAGLPIVASRIGQLGEILRHQETGLLCAPGDAAALAAALKRLRDDVALRQRLGKAARATAHRKHTWAAVARRVLGLAGHGCDTAAAVGWANR
jgi:glycosyltransferase involved in cell wall biosynthesis